VKDKASQRQGEVIDMTKTRWSQRQEKATQE